MSKPHEQDVENITHAVAGLARTARNVRELVDDMYADHELQEALIRRAFEGIDAVLVAAREAQGYATAKQYEVLYHVLSGLDKGLRGGDGQL